ncbi:MAG: N-acetylmuramoyl-L-alanine amidase [Oscillospiraceae bacterium]|nr:N-acetylmuramoyl-L-alanine amidase [Oscillospiraceae bacterium]
MKKTPAYKGSVFNSYPDLVQNRMNSTKTMQDFFNDQINEESLFENLIIHSPKNLNFSTNDEFAIFQGTYDDNFDVFLNDSKLTLNEAGNFYIEKKLEVGANYFKLEHKGTVANYTINRQVLSLHSIDASIGNGKTLEVEGGTMITFGAVAYRGATVTAVINGQSVRLTQQDRSLDDPVLNASYAPFIGQYTVPDGIINQTQNLGTITINADYRGNIQNAIGASVRVIALPEPPPPPAVEMPVVNPPDITDVSQTGTGEVIGKISAIRHENEAVKYVKVTKNNTVTLPGNTTGTIPDPNFSRLPSGTIDYYRSTAGSFYITENGKRISTEDAVLEDGVGMGENNLVVLAGGTSSDRRSFLRFALDSRSSFNVKAAGVEFHTERGDDHFNVKDFNVTHIYIDFDNVTSVTALPSFEDNIVFSAGKWETPSVNGVPKFRLVLELRKRGVYAGNYAQYNSDGELLLTFPIITQSLAGMSIVIDPGHGIGPSNWLDPGAIGHVREFDVNIAMAKKLQTTLSEKGAKVTVIPTDATFVSAFSERNNYARSAGCDLFISLHCNAVPGRPESRGTEVWYFTPFSQPLANAVSASTAEYFRSSVYSDKTLSNRGDKYSYFAVTLPQDYPAIMIELGFVTNYEEAMAMANDTHQSGLANAIAAGVQQYLNR